MCTGLLEESHADEERAWQIVIELIRRASDENQATYIGAVFLEDYLVFYGPDVIDKVRDEALSSRPLRIALRAVDWYSVNQAVRGGLFPLTGDADSI